MSKYIDADKIRNAIESEADNWQDTYTDCMRDNLLTILDSLQQEQPVVDLEKEIDNYIGNHFSEAHDGVLLSDASSMELAITDIAPMARHFFELGLNARKEG